MPVLSARQVPTFSPNMTIAVPTINGQQPTRRIALADLNQDGSVNATYGASLIVSGQGDPTVPSQQIAQVLRANCQAQSKQISVTLGCSDVAQPNGVPACTVIGDVQPRYIANTTFDNTTYSAQLGIQAGFEKYPAAVCMQQSLLSATFLAAAYGQQTSDSDSSSSSTSAAARSPKKAALPLLALTVLSAAALIGQTI